MSSIGTGYDLYTSTFSPDGRIFQVEYAFKAVDASGLVVGLRCKDGVVLAVERLISTQLYEKTSNTRITNVEDNIGFAAAGLYPDGEALSTYCVEEAQNYYAEYRSKVSPKYLSDRLAMYMHAYTLNSGVRPFGSCVLLAGQDPTTKKSQLFMVDPAGLSYGYFGIAVGRNKQAARTEIEKLKLQDKSLRELVKEAARIIHVVRDETKEKRWELELSWVGKETEGKHEKVPKELYEEAQKAAIAAKRALDEADDDDMQH